MKKSWMKKYDVNYHDHDDLILFYLDHCNHLEASKHSYSNQKTKKEVSFRKRNFLDQSEMRIESIENKEIKIFFEKNNNSKTILKKSIESNKTLIERRRIDELWKKKLRKIKTSSSRVLRKRLKINSFYDEMKDLLKEKIFTLKSDNVMKIHSITAASFNILSRQKNVEIFVVFMKDLDIQLKKQDNNKIIDSKSVISFEYHDFLNVFFKKKTNILFSHKKHDHKIEIETEKLHEYASFYNMSKDELLLIKKYLQKYLNKKFIKTSTVSYASFILFAKKFDEELRFCVDYRKLNAIIKKNKYLIFFIAKTIVKLFKARWIIKIDIKHAFNRIRMHSNKDQDLIIFKTKYDTYKYLIMFFELINESSTFQNVMNDTLMKYLNEFVIAYLDDILMYSNSKKDHVQHVRKILQRLRKTNIQVDVNKCEFHKIETKLLEMIVERDDVRMNSEKIKAIVEWKTSRHLKEVQEFLNFTNFYRQFIKNFSRIIKSLMNLTKKKRLFVWNNACQKIFDELKKRVIEVSILSYFSFELKIFVESDSSNYVSTEVLSQKKRNELIKSITYFFKTLSSVKCNYEIYDKKLLTIIRCFEQWRAKLQSIESFINVLINHKSLKYFMITKKLNKRQTKWVEFFVEFDFKIAYQSDKKNDKADSLIKRSDDKSKNESNNKHKHMHQTLLTSEKMNSQILEKINDTEENNSELQLFDRIKTTNQTNTKCTVIKNALERNEKNWNEMLFKHFKNVKNILFYQDKL
jgi:hypothetical protein